MFTIPEEVRTSLLPAKMNLQNKTGNFSLYIATEFTEVSQDPEYEQFLADVWVGIVLTLMVLSCVCCMCSCLLYHKFQQWKRSVIEARQAADLEHGYRADLDALPSYTVASGLPSYEEALEQMKQVQVKERNKSKEPNPTPAAKLSVHRLSVTDLFQIYRTSTSNSANIAASNNKS